MSRQINNMDRIDSNLFHSVILLQRQLLLIEHAVNDQGGALNSFEQAVNEGLQGLNHVLSVYNYVFSLIDHLARYQKIAHSIPRLSKKDPAYRALDCAMGNLKDIRNQLQHINNDIENEFSGPLLGAVCWASGQKYFLASLHDIGRERSSPGLIFDTRTSTFTQKFCCVYNGEYHDLEQAIKGARDFSEFVNSKVDIRVDGKQYDPKQHFVALAVEFRISPDELTNM